MKRLFVLAAGLTCFALACSDDETTPPQPNPGGAGGSASGGSSAGGTSAGGTSAGGSSTGGTSAGGHGGGAPSPDPQYLPSPTGSCPEFVQGTVLFEPAGIPARQVEIFIGPAAEATDGPLLFWWHGTGSSASYTEYRIGPLLDDIVALGGIVAAPYSDDSSGTYPWFLTTGSGPEDDLLLADEVLACAMQGPGVDIRRVHSTGMSAGGLHTVQMSYRRSGYLASVATFSGGLLGNPPQQETDNKFAAMIIHGGEEDFVPFAPNIRFDLLSEAYYDDLQGKGHFAFICNHGGGHELDSNALPAMSQFFQDHPFGTAPSPYAGGLPNEFPNYCGL